LTCAGPASYVSSRDADRADPRARSGRTGHTRTVPTLHDRLPSTVTVRVPRRISISRVMRRYHTVCAVRRGMFLLYRNHSPGPGATRHLFSTSRVCLPRRSAFGFREPSCRVCRILYRTTRTRFHNIGGVASYPHHCALVLVGTVGDGPPTQPQMNWGFASRGSLQ
jgi:hypothetical protein